MGIVENLKELVSTVQKIDNIELYRKILDLQGEAQDLVAENRRLRDEISELKRLREVSQELSYEHNSYWRAGTSGVKEGPFCSNCWDNREKLIRMHSKGDPNSAVCPTCEKAVNVTGRLDGESSLQAPPSF